MFCGHGKIGYCSRHIFETFVSMDYFASDASVFWKSSTWTRARPEVEFYLIPDTGPELFYTRSSPITNHNFNPTLSQQSWQ